MLYKDDTNQRPNKWLLRATRLGRFLWASSWVVNAILLLVAIGWVFSDPWFDDAWHWLGVESKFREPSVERLVLLASPEETAQRQTLLKAGCGLSLLTGTALLIGLCFGSIGQRRIRTWLLAMTLVSGWLGFILAVPAIAWEGQQWRLGKELEDFEPVASQLREDWPLEDNIDDRIGAFSAYPYGEASLLMRLTIPEDESIPWNTVTRSEEGGLRFRLGGYERGVWLEWHPADSQPASYRDGLEAPHELNRYAKIRDGWYAVEYELPKKRSASRQ